MSKIIIFGIQDTAELAHFYINNDSNDEVVAFTVHKAYLDTEEFMGLPVIPFELLNKEYPAEDYLLFAPMTGSNMNADRQKVYFEGKDKGYDFYTYISSKATCLTDAIGDNCFILEDNTIQPFVKIGNNVVLWSGNHIGHHSVIHDHVFFTSHVVLSGHCVVESNCWFGVNATIRNDCLVSKGTFVTMSASVTKDTEQWCIARGQPAKFFGDSRKINS